MWQERDLSGHVDLQPDPSESGVWRLLSNAPKFAKRLPRLQPSVSLFGPDRASAVIKDVLVGVLCCRSRKDTELLTQANEQSFVDSQGLGWITPGIKDSHKQYMCRFTKG